MHYTPNVDLAFLSVEHIMRDVSGGWLLRYLHANGASMLDGELESFVIFAPLVLRTSQAQSSAWSYGPVKRLVLRTSQAHVLLSFSKDSGAT